MHNLHTFPMDYVSDQKHITSSLTHQLTVITFTCSGILIWNDNKFVKELKHFLLRYKLCLVYVLK